MEARGNGPAYPAQYALHFFPNTSVPRFLTETVSLQRHRLRSRIVKLGSIDVVERRVEDVRMVDSAAINVRRQVPHICPRMDRGFPVRFNHIVFLFLLSHPRSLIPENTTHSRVYVDNRLQHMLSLRFDLPFFQRGEFPTSVSNASQEIIVPNPWAGRANSAPFDQRTSSRAAQIREKKSSFFKIFF